MDQPHTSSEQRSQQRAKCRQMLSDYLRSKLGIIVPPADIRMHPRKEDGYSWSVLPEKKHIFEKNLSKMSTGTYTQIMRGIGVFFEALPKDAAPLAMASQEPMPDMSESATLVGEKPEASFMANIARLQEQVTSLQGEAHRWQQSAESEAQVRVKLEAELERAKAAFMMLRKDNYQLKEDLQKTRKHCGILKGQADASDKGIKQLEAITYKLVAISGASSSKRLVEDCEME